LVCLVVFFLLLTGPQIALSLTQSGAVRWGEFRVVLAEAATGKEYARSVVLDQILTLLAFPFVVSVLLTVEMGLPFVLYAIWWFRGAGQRSDPWRRFLAWYPLAYLPIAFLLQAPNFGMRGMIPVQIMIVFAAALLVQDFRRKEWTGLQRAVLRYGFALILIAQMLSAGMEWMVFARRGLSEALRLEKGFFGIPMGPSGFPDGDNHLIPALRKLPVSLAYIYWANVALPPDALVVEVGLPLDYNRIHLLERMRFEDPAEVKAIPNAVRDITLVDPDRLDSWWASLGSGAVWEKALRSDYVLRRQVPVYLIVHKGTPGEAGQLIYQDDFVSIYLLQEGGAAAGKGSP
jgi:hypothetical protein